MNEQDRLLQLRRITEAMIRTFRECKIDRTVRHVHELNVDSAGEDQDWGFVAALERFISRGWREKAEEHVLQMVRLGVPMKHVKEACDLDYLNSEKLFCALRQGAVWTASTVVYLAMVAEEECEKMPLAA